MLVFYQYHSSLTTVPAGPTSLPNLTPLISSSFIFALEATLDEIFSLEKKPPLRGVLLQYITSLAPGMPGPCTSHTKSALSDGGRDSNGTSSSVEDSESKDTGTTFFSPLFCSFLAYYEVRSLKEFGKFIASLKDDPGARGSCAAVLPLLKSLMPDNVPSKTLVKLLQIL